MITKANEVKYTKEIEKIMPDAIKRINSIFGEDTEESKIALDYEGRTAYETWAHFEWFGHSGEVAILRCWMEAAIVIGAQSTYNYINEKESPTAATDPELAWEEAYFERK